MRYVKAACLLLAVLSLTGCETLKESSKYQFNEGFYKTRAGNGKMEKMYVVANGDSVKVYSPGAIRNQVDTNRSITIAFPPVRKTTDFKNYAFQRNTFDLDVLTILFKYRFPAQGFPNQLNATFNGAVYAGLRKDVYKLKYNETPLHIHKRSISHYGYSLGCFAGFGTARIDEYVTLNRLQTEYDGVVTLEGLAAIIALDKLTFGLTLGEDHLLDRNRKLWVNQARPWIGLSVGLNLN